MHFCVSDVFNVTLNHDHSILSHVISKECFLKADLKKTQISQTNHNNIEGKTLKA